MLVSNNAYCATIAASYATRCAMLKRHGYRKVPLFRVVSYNLFFTECPESPLLGACYSSYGNEHLSWLTRRNILLINVLTWRRSWLKIFNMAWFLLGAFNTRRNFHPKKLRALEIIFQGSYYEYVLAYGFV